MRLAKYLALCGVASRRKSETLIESGRIKVNGEVATDLGRQVDPEKDEIELDGNRVRSIPYGVALFYKPKHVVSTLNDPQGRVTIKDYLTKKTGSYVPVGRLDFESEGLIVLTNHGELTNRLLHPRYGHRKVYEVVVDGYLSNSKIDALEKGVALEDGKAKGEVDLKFRDNDHTQFLMTVTEGRNRMVRRMLAEVGHEVTKLKRLRHGPFSLGHLKPGEIRILSEREVSKTTKEILSDSDKEEKKNSNQRSNLRRNTGPNKKSAKNKNRRS